MKTRDCDVKFLQALVWAAVFLVTCNGLCDVSSDNDVMFRTAWSGVIESPVLASGKYPNNQDCEWNIEVSVGSRVNLTLESASLEEGAYLLSGPGQKKLCRDYVRISDSTGLLKEVCGEEVTPLFVTSSDHRLTVTFHTDASITSSGFRSTYQGTCQGGEITSGTIIATPNFPEAAPPGTSCRWVIPPNAAVSVLRSVAAREESVVTSLEEYLPKCGRSPFRVVLEGTSPSESELCLTDAVKVAPTSGNIVLLYDVTSGGSTPWVGQIEFNFTEDPTPQCQDLCVFESACQTPDVTKPGLLDHQCVCQSGYTGSHCETPLRVADPCAVMSCLQGQQCENLDSPGSYTCLCPPDMTGELCDTPVDGPCHGVVCRHGGQCVPESDVSRCHCPSSGQYIGQYCEINTGSPHCQQERDDVIGSLVTWSDTAAGDVDIQPCPGSTIGNATRNCILDASSPTGSRWTRPDLSMCVTPEILQISQDAQNLLADGPRGQPDRILNLTSRLLNATWPIMETTSLNQTATIFPGDLIAASGVMATVSEAAQKVDFRDSEAVDLAQIYTSTADNLVDPKALNTWKNARASLVEKRVSQVVESTQTLVISVVSRSSSTRRLAGHSHTAFEFTARNIEIKVSQNVLNDQTMTSSYQYGGMSSLVSVPTRVLNATGEENGVSPVTIYWAKFSTVSTLLSLQECRYQREVQNDSNTINSDVVSLAIMDRPKEMFQKLDTPIVFTFSLQDANLSDARKARCVFMNMSAQSYEDRWSSVGCRVEDSNHTHVVCHCYHLTNFAILMDVYGNQDDVDPTHELILTYISYIGGCLSVIACLFSIGVFQFFGLSNDRVRIHQQFGASIVLVQIFFICVVNTGPDQDTPLWGCRTVAILMHYSLTAMFCWMLVEGIHLYVVLVRVFRLGSHIKKYTLVGWGFPLVVVGISVGAFYDRYGTGDLCWLDHELLLVCFVPSVGLVLMINTVILVIVIRVMIKSHSTAHKITPQERSNASMGLKAAVVLLPLLGLTWVLAFLAVETRGSHILQYLFTYLFTLTNSFQGVLFFVFHCLLNTDVHHAYERRHRRRKSLSYLETTSSKRRYADPEFYHSHPNSHTPSKHTNTTRSTLTELSLVDQRSSEPHTDKHPILHLDEGNVTPRFSGLWARFGSPLVPAPDYHTADFRTPLPYRGSKRYTESDDVSTSVSIPRVHKTSVRFT